MRYCLERCVLAVLITLLGSFPVQADPTVTYEKSISTGGLDLYTISIDPNGGIYDTFELNATASGGATFNQLETTNNLLNFSPGNDDTDILGSPTIGAGFLVIQGEFVNFDTPTILLAAISSFGGPPTHTLTGPFAQLVASPGSPGSFDIRVEIFKAGLFAFEPLEFSIPIIPEPSTMYLLGVGLIGVAASRRRNS